MLTHACFSDAAEPEPEVLEPAAVEAVEEEPQAEEQEEEAAAPAAEEEAPAAAKEEEETPMEETPMEEEKVREREKGSVYVGSMVNRFISWDRFRHPTQSK